MNSDTDLLIFVGIIISVFSLVVYCYNKVDAYRNRKARANYRLRRRTQDLEHSNMAWPYVNHLPTCYGCYHDRERVAAIRQQEQEATIRLSMKGRV